MNEDQNVRPGGLLTDRSLPRWRRLLPFALALGLLGFIFSRLDLHAFVFHLRSLDVVAFSSFTGSVVVAVLAADTFATVLIYRRTIPKITFKEFFILRGASYLPSLLNHHVGQAFVTFFVSRAYSAELWQVAGATLVSYVSWLGCLMAAGILAAWIGGLPLTWLALPVALGLFYLVLIGLKPPKLVQTKLLSPLFEAGVGGHLLAILVRGPHMVALFLGTWLSFAFFDVQIPIRTAMIYIPVLMIAVTLPLTPQGFGTRDLVAVTFFEHFAVAPTHASRMACVVAATTTWGIASTFGEAALGLLLMRAAVPRILREHHIERGARA